ncbi:histone-lysine N-methyltransferase SETD5 isoform X3 [Polypterus senegalus]|uniref:histone-lysine N-methyltransferase SETD5 isoform X3 n=1 Tax=Polypterus senegalus TaxID=55291 RepID=UPI001966228D|nr:histone-lysine N-methyltransferase SETD5 isoform X3 [Polypterus senegalus]
MSIVIPLGVTTPDTSYSDMAAGSDPESVEASPAVSEKNNYSSHNCGNAQNHGYRGLPYADHNYGAPPPPTPPASPPTQTIIPRVELNGLRSRYKDNSADSESSSEENASSWCHCSLTQDGFVIKCENCRGLDRRKGVSVQCRKQENVSGGESSATESGDEEVSPATVSYTATQHTPTSITLTVNRIKRNKPKKRKKSTEKARGAPKTKKIKAFREGSRKSLRMKNSTTEASILDENTEEGWENRIRFWTDQYEEAFSNQYSADIQNLLQLHRIANKDSVGKAAFMDTINKTELACNNTVIGSQMQLQLGRVTRVQKHRKILRAARDLVVDTLIIEYRGKVMLRQQFEVNGHFFKKPYPFVLFYSKFNEVDMCVDARTFGNDARFIRRSCTPNAEVRHMIADGMIHLCIYAIAHITKDSEVTIGFDYEYSNCNYKVDCACHKGNQNCPVQKHNQSPFDLLPPPSAPPQIGAETRRRKAKRKEQELVNQGNISDENPNLQTERLNDSKDFQGSAISDSEEVSNYELKLEGNEGAESNDTGSLAQNKQELPIVEKTPAKPTATKSSKPRPKSRISRHRSSCSQRARRQKQAFAQQASDYAQGVAEEGTQGPCGLESGNTEVGLSIGQPADAEGAAGPAHGNISNRVNLKYPKTKKYLVTEWLNDKIVDKPECPIDRPLRITTDPTVLATTLNMLPGLSHSPLICTTPKHYIRFGSPFTPERRRRIVSFDGSYGSFKKRWIKQAMEEDILAVKGERALLESQHQSSSGGNTSNPSPCNSESSAPLKKRKFKYFSEQSTSELLRPLSPITPPPISTDTVSPLLAASCTLVLGEEEKRNGYNLIYSPLNSLTTSRCNTPLQFENISSPESSPAHRPESLSPEPCLRSDFDQSRTCYQDLSLPSSTESPIHSGLTATDEFPPVQSSFITGGSLCTGDSVNGKNVEIQAKDQAFRTEFNLIYACSPLNANLLASGNRNEGTGRGSTVSCDRRASQSEGEFSPVDAFFGRQSQGLMNESAQGAMSPLGDRQYSFSESGTPPHQNPPQKKKVSLLEYRKRKQEAKESFPCETVKSMGTPTRTCSGTADSPRCNRSTLHVPVHPESGFSSPIHSSIPQIEEVSPPDCSKQSAVTLASSHSKPQDAISSRWMVPTSVERLREGHGVLERVLRGGMKVERVLKRVESSSGESREKDSTDGENVEIQAVLRSRGSPVHSPSRYNQQLQTLFSEGQQVDTHNLLQQSMSPFRGHSSTYCQSAPSPGHGYRSTSHILSLGTSQNQTEHSLQHTTYSSPVHSSSSCSSSSLDSPVVPIAGSSGHYNNSLLHSGSNILLHSGSLAKSNVLGSQTMTSVACSATQSNCKTGMTDSLMAASTSNAASVNSTSLSVNSRLMQSGLRTLSPASPGQTVLQSGTKLLAAANSQHYQQRGTAINQYQHPQIHGSGVRTQSGTY